jgi:hypothetical protein
MGPELLLEKVRGGVKLADGCTGRPSQCKDDGAPFGTEDHMVSPKGFSANVAVLNAFVAAVAKEYGLTASARVVQPKAAHEPSIEVVVVKHGGAAGPLNYYGTTIPMSRYERAGTSALERFIREEAAPQLNKPP